MSVENTIGFETDADHFAHYFGRLTYWIEHLITRQVVVEPVSRAAAVVRDRPADLVSVSHRRKDATTVVIEIRASELCMELHQAVQAELAVSP